jgi:hypothetical protein
MENNFLRAMVKDQLQKLYLDVGTLRGQLQDRIDGCVASIQKASYANGALRQLQQLVEEYHWDINALQATGFTLEECGAALELAAVAGDPEADLLSEPLGLPEPKKGKGRPVIELEFTTREEMLQTRKALRKVNPDAGAAVRFLLGFEDEADDVGEAQ